MKKPLNRKIIFISLPIMVILISVIAVFTNLNQVSALPKSVESSKISDSSNIGDGTVMLSSQLLSSKQTKTMSESIMYSSSKPEKVSSHTAKDVKVPVSSSKTQKIEKKRADGITKIIASCAVPNSGKRKEQELTTSEIDQFMKLYKNVKLDFLDELEDGPLPVGIEPYRVDIYYYDHHDYLLLPSFRINKKCYKATDGAKEFVKFVNSLDVFKGVDICNNYVMGRNDGVTRVELNGGEPGKIYYLKENKIDEFLNKLKKIEFVSIGEKPKNGSTSKAYISIKGVSKDEYYGLYPQWIYNGSICTLDGEKDEFISYLKTFEVFKNVNFENK